MKMKLKFSIGLLAINIIILLLDFLFVSSLNDVIVYASLIWVMVSTPILLYLAMRSVRERIEKDAK